MTKNKDKLIILEREVLPPPENVKGCEQLFVRFEYKGKWGKLLDRVYGESPECEGDYVVMYNFQAAVFSTIYERSIVFSTFTDKEFLEAFNAEFPQYGLVSADILAELHRYQVYKEEIEQDALNERKEVKHG